jgi:phosphoribosylamine---glycine ligase
MKFLIITAAGDGGVIGQVLQRQGNDVKLCIESPEHFRLQEGMGMEIITSKQKTVREAVEENPDADIIFDGYEHYQLQDQLRRKGRNVFGSGLIGGQIEESRIKGVDFAKDLGVLTPPSQNIDSIDDVIRYIRLHPKRYIVKQTGDLPKTLNWAASRDDSEDLIKHLLLVQEKSPKMEGQLVLQEFIRGHEVAVTAHMSMEGWARQDGEIIQQINFENKHLLEGARGVTTGELGTTVFTVLGETPIFRKMLDPLTPFLIETGQAGEVDANCLVTDDGKIYLAEWTMRPGFPIISSILSLLDMPAAEFIHGLCVGQQDGYVFKEDVISVVLVLAFPNFPYEDTQSRPDSYMEEVLDLSNLTGDELNRNIFFVQARKKMVDGKMETVIGAHYGYALYAVGLGRTVDEANAQAVSLIQRIIPSQKGFWRSDIGMQSANRWRQPAVMKVIYNAFGPIGPDGNPMNPPVESTR